MRILLTHHFPLSETPAGRLVEAWAAALRALGHETRTLVVDTRRDPPTPWVDAVVCRAGEATADLPFDLPRFAVDASADTGPAFHELSDEQLTHYRDKQRRRLDALIDRFDPHVIHGQHVWVQGQLALESGVPYVINAWGQELDDYVLDERYSRLADQAAANAGRILVPDASTKARVMAMFEIEPERVLVMSDALRMEHAHDAPAAAAELVRLYQTLIDERYGPVT